MGINEKIKELIQTIMNVPRKKKQIIRENLYPEVTEIHNTLWKNGSLYSINNDTIIVMKLPKKGQYFKVISKISSDDLDFASQLFYKSEDEKDFTEEHSIWLGDADGELKINYFNAGKPISMIRLDSINGNGKFKIEYFEIIKIGALEYYIRTGKYKILFKIFKSVHNNPNLILKFLKEVKNNGIKFTIKKIINKLKEENLSRNIDNEIETLEKILVNYCKPYDFSIKTDLPIDIIIPVYNGFKFLNPLFDSIKKNTTIPYRLIIVNDKSPDKRVKDFLESLKDKFENIIVIHNEENLGFVKSVNKAVKYVRNHFVILNTDTEVPPNWLERLMWPIFNMERVASTTPFTNSGTIASFPKFLEDNEIFEGLSVEKLDSYFKKLKPHNFFVEVPSGVGFCMGINYRVYQKIGMFDEIFGKGYGEENDWCQRAIKMGYKNLMVPNLFVYHKHGGSFLSEEKKKLIKKNLKILSKKHPNYLHDVNDFIRRDPYKQVRQFFILKILNKIDVIIDHCLGGGANIYRDNFIRELINKNKNVLLICYDFYKELFILSFFSKEFNFELFLRNWKDVYNLLNLIKIDNLYINNLVSFSNVLDIVKDLRNLQNNIIVPLHDYFCICPSYNLLNYKGHFCNIPDDLDECKTCLRNNNLEWKYLFKKNNIDDINVWRNNWKDLLEKSDIICFSKSSKNLLLKAYPNVKQDNILIKPHQVNYIKPINKPLKEIKNIGILGSINFAKGSQIVKDLVNLIDKKNLSLKVILIGEINEKIESKNFICTGRYKKENLNNLVKKYDIDIFFIPSIWPETFSYATEEIIKMNMPIIVFNIGAPAERVKNYDKGFVIDNLSAFDVLQKLKELNRETAS